MITILFAPPRTGKTLFMTHMARETAFDRERTKLMQREILCKQASGFEKISTIPAHCVSANYGMVLRKFGYSPRFNRRINPYRLGFANPFVETHFNISYEAIFIDEAQKYLNSRMSRLFPDWQSRWYEQHGHDDLDIWLATQRPMLIDVNVRELSRFIEICGIERKFDCFGQPRRIAFDFRILSNSSAFDKYMASGKSDKSCYTEKTEIADYNVQACYDHQSCKPKFYDGHMGQDFDYTEDEPTEQTFDGYIKYLQENDDELPKNFYVKGGFGS
ncbi:MAG: hypothetical protein NC131_00345 [Roseburia sp.]|nr:hypothetical protein [Roseburia sp.]